MKYFLDTEFEEKPDQKIVLPISIGIVSESGREFYAEYPGFNWNTANSWLQAHVKPLLKNTVVEGIALQISEFIGADEPEFWGYFCAYDWVVFCQTFGGMLYLPRGWPQWCNDIMQISVAQGYPRLPIHSKTTHNALDDALATKSSYEFLINNK
jgi:hypothetical protein